ncbi:dTMP kinase [Methylohalobius crimeensis]|uniref:dTMP kinase n=1 Tax=Methylohalobius crimeensis TaxID=244365 RepID=UPI0003B470FD|nr:dTMP kinase [Methylohalobius crimeensis]
MKRRGRFITLEGGEGVGKTTNLDSIRSFLEGVGIEVVTTREPGGVPIGERLRELIVTEKSLLPEAELLLLFAGRVHHVHELILPALAQGKWVVSDRFVDASFAYQGGGRGMPWQRIEYLEEWLLKECKPDLTLLLDAPVEVGLERARARGEVNRFEDEALAFMQRVRRTYLSLGQRYPDRIKRIDVTQSLPRVQREIMHYLQPLVDAWRE